MKKIRSFLEKLHIPYWVINLASITILLPVFLVCFHLLEFYLVKYSFEAELSKNEAQEICGHLSDAGKRWKLFCFVVIEHLPHKNKLLQRLSFCPADYFCLIVLTYI